MIVTADPWSLDHLGCGNLGVAAVRCHVDDVVQINVEVAE